MKSTPQYVKENEQKLDVINKDSFCITIDQCMTRKRMTKSMVLRAIFKGQLDYIGIQTPTKRRIFVVINKKYTDLRRAQYAPFNKKEFFKFMEKFMTKSPSHSRRV